MTRTTTTLAVAADYADALLVARRAKNWVFLFLILTLLAQIGVFCAARFVPNLHGTITTSISAAAGVEPTTQTTQVVLLGQSAHGLSSSVLQYVVAVTVYLGVTLPLVLGVVLLLILVIMLVGRLVGVTHVAGAFVWCVLLAAILFPWQTLLAGPAAAPVPDPRIPGILYTWPELARDYDFSNNPWQGATLKWARYAGFPAIAIIVLLTIQGRSSRGLRYALGESEIQIDIAPPAP